MRPVIRQQKSAGCCKASTDHVPGRSKSSKPYDVKSVVFKKTQYNAEGPPEQAVLLMKVVGVVRLELTASSSQTLEPNFLR